MKQNIMTAHDHSSFLLERIRDVISELFRNFAEVLAVPGSLFRLIAAELSINCDAEQKTGRTPIFHNRSPKPHNFAPSHGEAETILR